MATKICPIMSKVVESDDPEGDPSLLCHKLHEVECTARCAWWDEDNQECIHKGEVLRKRAFQAELRKKFPNGRPGRRDCDHPGRV